MFARMRFPPELWRSLPPLARRGVGALVAVVIIGVVIVVSGVLDPARAYWNGDFPAPRETPPAVVERTDFVGAERCASCHEAQYAKWRASTHARAGGAPGAETVIAPFGSSMIRFANAHVTPRLRDGVYEFEIRRDGEPNVILRVDGVVGGGHMYGGGTQAYFTDRPDGSWRLIPFEWSRQRGAWFCNTNSRSGKGWSPITPALRLEECGDWPPARALGEHPRLANCQSCHASQAAVVLDSAAQGYRTRFTSLAINCESCHGPGQRHVRLAERGELGQTADIGFAALATRDKDGSLRVCFQCHAIKDQLRAGFASGDSLEQFYSMQLPSLGDRPLHPDGRIRTFAYQEGHRFSDCYLNGNMTCTSCHEAHGQTYQTVTGASLPGRFDDGQCTSCHLSKAGTAVEHTHHTSPDVRCVSCHMAPRQEPETRAADARHGASEIVPYARYDHTISIPRPALDSTIGLTSACGACHAAKSTTQLESDIRDWWGELKPVPPVIAAQLRVRDSMSLAEAAPLLLGTEDDGGDRLASARFAGVSRFFERYVDVDQTLPPEVKQRLQRLTTASNPDIRAAALVSLHLAAGDDRGVRRRLADALRAEGAHDLSLRARWATMLGFAGDRYSSAGNLGNALAAYQRALQVQPSSARLHASLGNAYRAAKDPARAVAAYQQALALERRDPLVWVNLSLAFDAMGDKQRAYDALIRANSLDASEPLVWYNLGNTSLVAGDLDRARQLYERAAALDPGIPLVHFQLARLSLLRGDSSAALGSLRRGLAFDSSEAEARDARDALQERLRRSP
jgi:tetratricopeptide (TPR) repeat protein